MACIRRCSKVRDDVYERYEAFEMSLVGRIRRATQKLGLDVTRFGDVKYNQVGRLSLALRYHAVDLIIDIGANDGGYAREMRAYGYSGRFLSFEPLAEAHRGLVAASKGDQRWLVADRMAIGSFDGEVDIHVAENSVSSSILEVGELHTGAEPKARTTRIEKVPIRTLDSIDHPAIRAARKRFLKIDTQGYEGRVLDGAAKSLQSTCGVQLELSVVALYEGQELYMEIFERLRVSGFELWGLMPGFVDTATGRTLQFDGVFFR